MKVPNNIQKTALVAAVTLAISGIATVDNDLNLQMDFSSVISSAYAGDSEGSSGGGHKGAMGAKQGGQGQRGQGGEGYKGGGKSVADILADDDEGDGGKPDDAGARGFAGENSGKPDDTGSGKPSDSKGESFGDLFVILRDENGEPVTDGDEVYILLTDGTWVKTVDGEVPAGTDMNLVQEVEFGRMNIARAPDNVTDHALVEALMKLDGVTIDSKADLLEYTDDAGRLSSDEGTVESPVESLAVFEALLTAPIENGLLVLSATSSHDGSTDTYTLKVDPDFRLDLAAAAIAAASDKTGELEYSEIVHIASITGVLDELALYSVAYSYDPERYDYEVTLSLPQPLAGDGDPETPESTDPVTFNLDDWLDEGKTIDGVDYAFNEVMVPSLTSDPSADDGTYDYSGDLSGIYLFTQAADEAVQVLEIVHEFE